MITRAKLNRLIDMAYGGDERQYQEHLWPLDYEEITDVLGLYYVAVSEAVTFEDGKRLANMMTQSAEEGARYLGGYPHIVKNFLRAGSPTRSIIEERCDNPALIPKSDS